MRGTVSFVGAGPGAADLLTLRGAQRIADADLVLYASGTTDPAWLRANTDAELVDCARLGPEEIAEHYRRLASRRGAVVRLVGGDPAMAARLREQLDLCARLGLDVEVVPGVSTVSAAAPVPLLEAGSVDSLAVTTVETDFTAVRELAGAGRTLAVRAPAARTADLVEALLAAGIGEDTPAVVADKPSRPDEVLVRTTVGELVAEVKKHNLWRTALFLVGDTLRASGKARQQGEEPAPRWTARSWRRPTDEPRKTWAERRAEAAAEPAPEKAEDTGAERHDRLVPVSVGTQDNDTEESAAQGGVQDIGGQTVKPKPARAQGKRAPRPGAKRAAKKV